MVRWTHEEYLAQINKRGISIITLEEYKQIECLLKK